MYLSKYGSPIKARPWHKDAVKMARQGMGATEIAEILLGRKSQESTVRDFLSKLDEKHLVPVFDKLKVLFWDIETSPSVYATFGIWQQNLGKGGLLRAGGLLSHAWSWGNSEQVYSSVLTVKEALENDYSRIVYEMWSLLDHADVVVAHNGKKFDIRKANAEFIKLGLPPPSPYKVYDTLRVAKRYFFFDRNDLDSLCDVLNVPYRKIKNEGMPLWVRCIQGDQQALDDMETYNKGDIPTLRAVFKKLLPWDNQGINFALMGEEMNGCPYCGEDSLEQTTKFVYTSARKYPLYRCTSCGANSRAVHGSGDVMFSRVA